MDEELESFKRDIRLHEYAASQGYSIDKSESSRRELIMRSGADKISIRRDIDGHYVFYSFRDASDNGTIIDFVRRRETRNFGEIRKKLRPWVGRSLQIPLPEFQDLIAAPRADRGLVAAEYAKMKPLAWHDYLEKERCLPRPVLKSPRFKDSIRVDARGNAVFPHYDNGQICGFEKRNRQFKGFADQGEKGLWLSARFDEDVCLVVGESAIDCVSYHAIHPNDYTRYASIAGGLNPAQPDLLLAECRALPLSSKVVSITHADKEGDYYASVIEKAAKDAGLLFRVDRPLSGVKDWNDELRRQSFSLPAARFES